MASKTPDPIDKYVGSRIRMRRIMLGMSQEKLGDALGLTFQQVQKYEKGTNRVGASRLQQIADVLQVHRRPMCPNFSRRQTDWR
jgi:transcriptional regulator with XRE-family HTH domain